MSLDKRPNKARSHLFELLLEAPILLSSEVWGTEEKWYIELTDGQL